MKNEINESELLLVLAQTRSVYLGEPSDFNETTDDVCDQFDETDMALSDGFSMMEMEA